MTFAPVPLNVHDFADREDLALRREKRSRAAGRAAIQAEWIGFLSSLDVNPCAVATFHYLDEWNVEGLVRPAKLSQNTCAHRPRPKRYRFGAALAHNRHGTVLKTTLREQLTTGEKAC